MHRTMALLLLLLWVSACAQEPTHPPSLLSLEAIRPKLSSDLTPTGAEQAFGPPTRVVGSGLLIYVYELEHAHSVHLGFPGHAPILYAKLQRPDGQLSDLPLER